MPSAIFPATAFGRRLVAAEMRAIEAVMYGDNRTRRTRGLTKQLEMVWANATDAELTAHAKDILTTVDDNSHVAALRKRYGRTFRSCLRRLFERRNRARRTLNRPTSPPRGKA